MNERDLSTLPKRMRFAADVVKEVTARENLSGANPWSADRLRKYAEVWEIQDAADFERDAEVEALAQEIHAARWPRHIDPTNGAYLPDYRVAARKLIESGWRKGDPA